MTYDDGRKIEAKGIPIMEVAERLGIAGLRPAGVERVGPCPVCDGKDRFGINPARGLFVCRQCDVGGDGLALVQHVHQCDFQAALRFLVGDADAQIDPAEIAKRRAEAETKDKKRQELAAQQRARAIRDAREIWHRAVPGEGTAAEDYLAARNVIFPSWPPTLRFLPAHPYVVYSNGQFHTLHAGPCMIAAIQNPAGQVAAVHQTWIIAGTGQKAAIPDFAGKAQPAKKVRGSKKGGAIRLTALGTSGVMIAGEGIETTGSAVTANAIPLAAYWCLVDLGNMGGRQLRVEGKRHSGLPDMSDADAWVPPLGTKKLYFIQDGDSAAAPTRAKLLAGLRRAQKLEPGLCGSIVHPGADVDLNDVINDAGDGSGVGAV